MKTLTALTTALALFAFIGIAFAGATHTHCRGAGDPCISAHADTHSTLTPEDYLE